MATAVTFTRHVLGSEIPLGFTLERVPTLKFANCETQGGALAVVYMVSLRLRRKAGTSRSACSKLAIMALRMLSRAIPSADADAMAADRSPAPAAGCASSITIGGGSGMESKSSAVLTTNP